MENGTIIQIIESDDTSTAGFASGILRVTEEMESIYVSVSFDGNNLYDEISTTYDTVIIPISAGLEMKWIVTIIVGAIAFSLAMAFVVYRLVRAKPFEELMEKVSEKDLGQLTQQVTRVVSESEKQAARQQLESEDSDQNNPNLSRDETSLRQSRAINAYLDTEQEVQKKYLSDVIGIDVYT